MPSWKKVIISGSDAELNSLNVTTVLTASGLIYPTTDGLVNQSIVTDGAGNLIFGNPYSDNTIVYGKNISGTTIAKGTPLYFTGSGTSGNLVGVYPADAGNPARMPAGGIAGEQLLDEAEGVVLLDGFISQVNTSAFNSGDLVYVAVGGGYTNVAPTGSTNLIQTLGYVEKVGISNGSGVIKGPGVFRTVPNIQQGYTWVGNADGVATPIATSSIQNVISSSYALTSSNVEGGDQYYVPIWDTDTHLSSSYLYQSGSVLKTIYNGADKGLTLDYNFDSFILGNAGTGNNTYFQVFDGGSTINVYSSNYTYFNDKVGVRIIPTNPGLAVSGSLEVTGPGTVKFMGTNAQITGSLTVTGGITGSLFGTASWAENTLTASYVLNAVSASYADNALSSSYAVSASYADNVLSSSYAVTASYVEIFPYTGSAKITGSLLVTGSVKSTTVQSNIFINNQTITDTIYVPSGSNALIIGPVDISEEVVVEGGGNLYITDFTNPTPDLQAVTDVGSTTTNSITAANFITTSDKRLKSEIKAIKNPFKVLDSIKSYEYIKDGKKDAGFLAQEVQETIPYAVFENEEGMLTMSDRPLLAYLYAAVMELKEENKKLKKELKSIKP